MKSFAAALKGGDRRSIGRVDAVAAEVRRSPGRFEELWTCLTDVDPLVRMRAADALEKLSRNDAGVLRGHKADLLSLRVDDGTAEVRWHVIAMVSRLTLTAREAKPLFAWFEACLRDDVSRIVKVVALQAACDLAAKHPALAVHASRMVAFARVSPWPSVRARAAKLAMS